ncbi:cation-transporting P-type ATPase, partial [Arthrospira platensis SPKY1]|nr:cation-transporting P-type ATPase [Arthrospira platensis SPKY1]
MIQTLPEQVFSKTSEAVLSAIQTDPENGLSAKEVQNRREHFGENRLERQRQKPVLLIFLEQFLDPVIYVLVAAAGLGFVFGEI